MDGHRGRMRHVLVVAAGVIMLAGCSAADVSGATASPTRATTASAARLSQQDEAALAQLRRIASTGADEMDGDDTVTETDCWTPSEHLVVDASSDSVFRVICRVHYLEKKTVKRYQDVICVGDFDAVPMLDHCYHWASYSDMPRYEDGDALASPPPTPLR